MLERQSLHRRHGHGSTPGRTVGGTVLPSCRANESQPCRRGISLTGRVVLVLAGGGGGPQGVNGDRRGLRHDWGVGGCRKVKREGRTRVAGKAAGDEGVFIPGKGPGWQMRRAVKGVTGPLDRVA
jgi:hypothetical protein